MESVNNIDTRFFMSLFVFLLLGGPEVLNSNFGIVFTCKNCKTKIRIDFNELKQKSENLKGNFKCPNCNSKEVLEGLEVCSDKEENKELVNKLNNTLEELKEIYQKELSEEGRKVAISNYIYSKNF